MNGKWTVECRRREIDGDGQRTCAKNTEKWREIEYASEIHKEYALIIHTTVKLLSQRLVATDLSYPPPFSSPQKKDAN